MSFYPERYLIVVINLSHSERILGKSRFHDIVFLMLQQRQLLLTHTGPALGPAPLSFAVDTSRTPQGGQQLYCNCLNGFGIAKFQFTHFDNFSWPWPCGNMR